MLPSFVLVVICASVVFGAANNDLQNENIFKNCSPYIQCVGSEHLKCKRFCVCQGYGRGGKCKILQKAPAPRCQEYMDFIKQHLSLKRCVCRGEDKHNPKPAKPQCKEMFFEDKKFYEKFDEYQKKQNRS